MREVEVVLRPPYAAIAVDGRLDLIRAHDLRRAVEDALLAGCREVSLDLSRVAVADSTGVNAVVWCREQLEASGGALVVDGLSGPLNGVTALAGLRRAGGARESAPSHEEARVAVPASDAPRPRGLAVPAVTGGPAAG